MNTFSMVLLFFIQSLSVVLYGQKSCQVTLEGCGNYYIDELYDTCNVVYAKRIRIPIIFHIVYKNKKENIDYESIRKELKDLQQDFLKINGDTIDVLPEYKSLIANPNIEFYLAPIKLDGEEKEGIIRRKRNFWQKPNKVSPVIEPDKNLNVYVYTRFGKGGHTLSRPWSNPPTDAVCLSYNDVGRGYRILTHEVGHWLGLMHIFECNNCSEINDGIADTPAQNLSSDGGFVIKENKPELFPLNCIGNRNLYNNFMDYSLFRRMFTKDQVRRMRIIISNQRQRLLNNN